MSFFADLFGSIFGGKKKAAPVVAAAVGPTIGFTSEIAKKVTGSGQVGYTAPIGDGLGIHGEPLAREVGYSAPTKKSPSKYRVKFYTGGYLNRQACANEDHAICFVSHHFNSDGSKKADYALCVVAKNASDRSKVWAADYVVRISDAFVVPRWNGNGVCVGGMGGRGDSQIRHTAMPAILCEPLFCSNPHRAEQIRSESGRLELARCLVESIRETFPDGGLVAFSVGHKYKLGSHRHDRGAAVHGGGTEADYAEMVLDAAAEMLQEGIT